LVSIPKRPVLQDGFFHIWAKDYDLTLKIATIFNTLTVLKAKNTKAPIEMEAFKDHLTGILVNFLCEID
ncbi:hypothetical protein ABT56_13160, partial [Photobacterium aquae]